MFDSENYFPSFNCRYGFTATALSPSLLLLLTPISKHLSGGLKRTIFLGILIPFVKIPRQKNTYLESSQRLGRRKRFLFSTLSLLPFGCDPFFHLHQEKKHGITYWPLKATRLILWFLNCSWQLKGFEFVKAVHLDPVPFDMERDLITPTYKKKRPQLLKYYQVAPLILIFMHDVNLLTIYGII